MSNIMVTLICGVFGTVDTYAEFLAIWQNAYEYSLKIKQDINVCVHNYSNYIRENIKTMKYDKLVFKRKKDIASGR